MRFKIQISVDDYWDYVVEATSESEARERAAVDFKEMIGELVPSIDIDQVADDAPLGDV